MTGLILYIFIVTSILCTCVFLGIYVLMLSPAEKPHRLFFISALVLSLIYIMMILMQASGSINTVWLFYRIATSLIYFFFYFMLLFIIFLTRAYRYLAVSHFILALCVIFTVITMLSGQYIVFSRTGSLLVISDFILIADQWINPAYYMLIFFLYAFILFPRIKSGPKREKMQYIIIFTTLFISYFIMMIFVILQAVFHYGIYPIGPMPIFFIIFITGCMYAIIKFRLLAITPGLVSTDILANINESIILLSADMKIITVNPSAKRLLRLHSPEGKDFNIIVAENSGLSKEIDGLLNKELTDFSCRLFFTDADKKLIPMESRFSLVKDTFRDAIGVLIIAREVKEIGQLKSAYKITNRETEIIQNIIMGYTNSEIAKALSISANTLKQHITNIYNKLGVSNKMQLLSLLKEFNLIPSQHAEKSFFFLK